MADAAPLYEAVHPTDTECPSPGAGERWPSHAGVPAALPGRPTPRAGAAAVLAALLLSACLLALVGPRPGRTAVSVPVVVGYAALSEEAQSYPNATLRTPALNVTVFLPPRSPSDRAYYNSTRFDWSSMIGDVRIGSAKVFGSSFWRAAHDLSNPESGVGLAAEFGCGEMGAKCGPGFNGATDVANGVLGYEEACQGCPFLKIGVGKLLKGSCADCEAGDDYTFTSAYKFAEFPAWNVSNASEDSVEMSQEASLGDKWGYRLTTRVRARGSEVAVESELHNLGSQAFSTAHYSHNFLSVDDMPTGPPLRATLAPDLQSYEEPGVSQKWAQPLADFFSPAASEPGTLEATKALGDSAQVKAVFGGDANRGADASWSVAFGDKVTVARTTRLVKPPLYAYNLYVERTTLSPEPMQLISIGPGEHASWSSTLTFTEGKLQ